jgi:hypothetical protein
MHEGDDQSPLIQATFAPMAVERVFRGNVPAVVFLTPAVTPGYPEPGRRYLIYGRHYSAGPDTFMSGEAYGSKPLDEAEDDVTFLAVVAPNAGGNTISGVLEEEEIKVDRLRSGFALAAAKVRVPLPNVRIRISNSAYAAEALTDAAGQFVATGLPDGLYSVDPSLPPDLIAPITGDLRINVAGNGCATLHIRAFANGRIRGTIKQSGGAAFARATVDMTPADDVIAKQPGNIGGGGSVSADGEGRFEFDHVLPGRYWIGFNLRNGPAEGGHEYPRTYYPGVPDETAAVPIVVERAGVVTGVDFSVGEALAAGSVQVTIDTRGHVGRLTFHFENLDNVARSWTGGPVERGQVMNLPVLEGVHYEVHAHLEFDGGHVESAPAEFVGTSGEQSIRLIIDRPRKIHP